MSGAERPTDSIPFGQRRKNALVALYHRPARSIRFAPCKLGFEANQGWLVYYKKGLIAMLGETDDGKIVMMYGLEAPFVCDNWAVMWPSLDAAMADFGEMYSAPAIRDFVISELGRRT